MLNGIYENRSLRECSGFLTLSADNQRYGKEVLEWEFLGKEESQFNFK
jgi:hypothetical protein